MSPPLIRFSCIWLPVSREFIAQPSDHVLSHAQNNSGMARLAASGLGPRTGTPTSRSCQRVQRSVGATEQVNRNSLTSFSVSDRLAQEQVSLRTGVAIFGRWTKVVDGCGAALLSIAHRERCTLARAIRAG
jgi:hypothetical protein